MGKLTHWSIIFAVIGLFAAVLGFGGAAGAAAPLAKVLFWFAVAMMGLTLTFGLMRRT